LYSADRLEVCEQQHQERKSRFAARELSVDQRESFNPQAEQRYLHHRRVASIRCVDGEEPAADDWPGVEHQAHSRRRQITRGQRQLARWSCCLQQELGADVLERELQRAQPPVARDSRGQLETDSLQLVGEFQGLQLHYPGIHIERYREM
jgi:hypothetical protein